MTLLKKGKDKLGYLDTMLAIFRFESKLLSGPGSYRKDIRETLWTIDELMSDAVGQDIERTDVERLIKNMSKETDKQIMVVKDDETGIERYTTRVAETIRIIGHAYEYWYKGRPGVDALRWEVEKKQVPNRTILAEAFIQRLHEGLSAEVNFSINLNLKQAIVDVIKGVAQYLVGNYNDWKDASFSEFQFDSTIEMLKAQYVKNYEKHSQILTAGVGSGKTIAFVIAVFVSVLDSIKNDLEDDTRTHLLLYPRTALAEDQYDTISEMAYAISPHIKILFDHASYYKSIGLTVKEGIKQSYAGRYPPNIIVTTLETLKRRLQNPIVVQEISGTAVRVVLDEIHLIQGMAGGHVIRLIQRLKAINNRRFIFWTGSSATVAAPDSHAAMVFGISKASVSIIEPSRDDLIPYGIANHVFLRPSPLMSAMGTLVNTTSLLVHGRRDCLHRIHSRPNIISSPKTIGFADDLDLLGRWNSDLRENERTENAIDRNHPNSLKPKDWKKAREREIPYALRYISPLSRRICADTGTGANDEVFRQVLPELKEINPCKLCRNGKRMKSAFCTEDDLYELARFVQRDPTRNDDPAKRFNIRNGVFRGAREINTLDLCPYLQAGACLWFADDDFEAEAIRGTNDYEYRNIVRSRIYSSKTKDRQKSEDEDLSSAVFMGPTREVYDVPRDQDGELVSCDIVLSSPSLEVGIDLKNVTESIMYKAIRNIASYRQKTGRAGREEGKITINVTLVSQSPIDFHYYRQPRKLTSIAQLDPIPLEDKNQSIMKSSLYCAVWDYLASCKNSSLPEIIPYDGTFSISLSKCIKELEANRNLVANHLSFVSSSKYSPDSKEVQDAIDIALSELKFLITPTVGIFRPDSMRTLADVVESFLSGHTRRAELSASANQPFESIKNGQKDYWDTRPYISPISLELEGEFNILDKMARCGWDGKWVKDLKTKIKGKSEDSALDIFLRNHLNKIAGALESVEIGIDALEKEGITPLIVSFYDQFTELRRTQPPKAYYLSFILQELPIFRLFRDDLSYVSPENLFTSPYDNDVEVAFRGWNSYGVPIWVPLTEVLFSLIPGTWSFRWGVQPYKSLIGKLDDEPGGVLKANYDNLSSTGCMLIRERMNIKNPIDEDETLNIYRPIRLTVKQTGKYQRCQPNTGLVVDEDEKEKGTQQHADKIKIPKSFLARWVSVDTREGEPIRCYSPANTNQRLLIKDNGNIVEGEQAREQVKHPLLNGLISSVSWHENLEAIDFVYSVLRSYSKPNISGRTIVFDYKGKRFGFGRTLTTRGVSIDLNQQSVVTMVDSISNQMLSGNKIWIPTAFKALTASLLEAKIGIDTKLDRFIVRDLVAILLVSIYPNLEQLETKDLFDLIKDLITDKERLEKAARKYYSSKSTHEIDLVETDEPEDDSTNVDISDHVSRFIKALEGFEDSLNSVRNNLQGYLKTWLKKTLLNSFGHAAVTALQKLSGVTGNEVGYTFVTENKSSDLFRIYLFDRDQYGNGSCKVLQEFFHILHIQRYMGLWWQTLLPTYDYATLLEEELLQCPQFHQDLNALAMYEEKRTNNSTHSYPELDYVSDYSSEILRVSENTWNALGITGRNDVWKLPLINIIAGYVATQHQGVESDDVIRATGICWNGCPECSDSRGGAMGAIAGDSYIDKAVLDEWFRIGRSKANEYKTVKLEDLKGNQSIIEIGAKSKLGIKREDDVFLRSVSLPHTIGLEINRTKPDAPMNIVIRDNDVSQLAEDCDGARTSWHGIPGQAFRRLVWHNLLTLAFLDSLDILKDSEKEIWLLYFDVRDLDFIDTGMSGRAMEVIEHYHDASVGAEPIEKLSDVLIWLANRGFKIKICTSKIQIDGTSDAFYAEKIKALLLRLKKTRNISVLVKEVKGGVMHKKGLRTGIGIISGSANLTFRASTRNEEDLSYFLPSDGGYKDMTLSLDDTIQSAEQWGDD